MSKQSPIPILVVAWLFASLFLPGPVQAASPLPQILLFKDALGETKSIQLLKSEIVAENLQGQKKDGQLFIVGTNRVVVVLPGLPDRADDCDPEEVRAAIQRLSKTPADLLEKAGIGPRDLVRWDEVQKLCLQAKKQQTLVNQAKEQEQKAKEEERKKIDQAKWLEEARDFMRPRTEEQLSLLKSQATVLLGQNPKNEEEIKDYAAVLAQVLPQNKGGPLPDLQKLSNPESEIVPDGTLVWLAGGIYFISLLLLLFGLSYTSNFFTCLQGRKWIQATLYICLAPCFLAGLWFLWWAPTPAGVAQKGSESEKFKEMDLFLKNKNKPVYYFPPRKFVMAPEVLVEGLLAKVEPAKKSVGYLKGRLGVGELRLGNGRWSWSQGLSIMGLPFEVPFCLEGPLPDTSQWRSPTIELVSLGRLKLSAHLASIVIDAWMNTYQDFLGSTLVGNTQINQEVGKEISILVPSSGVRPSFAGVTRVTHTPVKNYDYSQKEIAAEDLALYYEKYMNRYILIDGYVKRVTSGLELSGGSKVEGAGEHVSNNSYANVKMTEDRYDEFELESWREGVKITCYIKSKAVFAMQGQGMMEVPETGQPLEGGDVYWGPRAQAVFDEPLIKKGKRVKFLSEGRVELEDKKTRMTTIRVMGIRLDTVSDIMAYDPHPVIKFLPLKPVTVGESDFDLTAESNSKLPILFESSDPSVAEILRGSRVKIKKPGTTIITAIHEGNKSWLPASIQQILVVEPAPSNP